MKILAQRTIAMSVCLSMIGCSTTRDYASVAQSSSKGTVTLRNCDIRPMDRSPAIGLSSYWTGNCGIDGAEGAGLATWGATGAPKARYTGSAKAGKLNGDGGVFVDGIGRFEGELRNGAPFLGRLTEWKGSKYEGRFGSDGTLEQGMMVQPDGTKVAGKFVNRMPVGKFVIVDPRGTLWRGGIEKGKIVKRSPMSWRDPTALEQLAALGIVLVAGIGFAMAFAATGGLLFAGAAMGAASTPVALRVLIFVAA